MYNSLVQSSSVYHAAANTTFQKDGSKKGRGKKKKGQDTANIKNSPINLRDGDILGLKVNFIHVCRILVYTYIHIIMMASSLSKYGSTLYVHIGMAIVATLYIVTSI